jgi:hypothetical protein
MYIYVYMYIYNMSGAPSPHDITDSHYRGLNIGIRSFGLNEIVDVLGAFADAYPELPIISVGSGNAVFERYSTLRCGRVPICVDPKPGAFAPLEHVPLIAPSYPCVDALISAQPYIVENCIIILNWCNARHATFDIDAIRSLHPVAVFTIYGSMSCGAPAAGSSDFCEWLGCASRVNRYVPVRYNNIHTTSLIPMEGMSSCMNLHIKWLQRRDVQCENAQIEDLPCTIPSKLPCQVDCCIM